MNRLTYAVDMSLRMLLAFWYLSVGARTAAMLCCHLPCHCLGYRLLMPPPLSLAKEPIVDRTLQSLRNRSAVTLVMSGAELFAAGVRITLWTRNQLNQLQIEMTIKNLLFLYSIYGASDMYSTTNRRDWNSRILLPGILEYPTRMFQLQFFRFFFVGCYLVQGSLMSWLLSYVSPPEQHFRWQFNVFTDCILCFWFLVYCRNICYRLYDRQNAAWYWPQPGYHVFPNRMGIAISMLLMVNLFCARVPALYHNYANFAPANSDSFKTYSVALGTMVFSIITIGTWSMYWSIAYMLFNKEFTTSPGNYQVREA